MFFLITYGLAFVISSSEPVSAEEQESLSNLRAELLRHVDSISSSELTCKWNEHRLSTAGDALGRLLIIYSSGNDGSGRFHYRYCYDGQQTTELSFRDAEKNASIRDGYVATDFSQQIGTPLRVTLIKSLEIVERALAENQEFRVRHMESGDIEWMLSASKNGPRQAKLVLASKMGFRPAFVLDVDVEGTTTRTTCQYEEFGSTWFPVEGTVTRIALTGEEESHTFVLEKLSLNKPVADAVFETQNWNETEVQDLRYGSFWSFENRPTLSGLSRAKSAGFVSEFPFPMLWFFGGIISSSLATIGFLRGAY